MSLMAEVGQKAFDLGVPLAIHMDVTYRCNERCVHCYLDHDDHGEMTTAEIKHLLKGMADAGVFILTHPGGGLLALTLIIACFLLIYGVFALVLAFQLKPHSGWGWVLFDAIVTILLGVLILEHWPINAGWIVGTLLGISFISSGVSRLMLSLAVRKLADRAV